MFLFILLVARDRLYLLIWEHSKAIYLTMHFQLAFVHSFSSGRQNDKRSSVPFGEEVIMDSQMKTGTRRLQILTPFTLLIIEYIASGNVLSGAISFLPISFKQHNNPASNSKVLLLHRNTLAKTTWTKITKILPKYNL